MSKTEAAATFSSSTAVLPVPSTPGGTVGQFLRILFPTGMTPGFGRGFSVYPISTFHARHAVIFGSLVGGVKTGFADWFVQVFVEEKDMGDVNWKRIQAFL